MVKAKRAALGVRKQNKRKKRRVLKSLVRYLNYDCYLFAPLFSASPPSDSAAVFGTAEINRGNQNRRTSEKVEEFLKSDYHLYGSMISPPKLGSPLKGCRVTMEVSTNTRIVMEDGHRTLRSSNVKRNERYSKTSTFRRRQDVEQSNADKPSVHQLFHSSSSPEEQMAKPSQRRVAIE